MLKKKKKKLTRHRIIVIIGKELVIVTVVGTETNDCMRFRLFWYTTLIVVVIFVIDVTNCKGDIPYVVCRLKRE